MNETSAISTLRQIRTEVGRLYKSKIRTAWETGNYDRMGLKNYAGALQSIRNTYGPSWLNKVRL